MSQSELENKIQLESDKFVFDLEKRYGHSEFENTVIRFLKSKPQRFLLMESSDTSASAWKILEVLKELQCVPDLTACNDYLGSQNQTVIQWMHLSKILWYSEVVPKFKNLLVCVFDESVSSDDETLISTYMERLSFALKRKVIFLISSKDNVFFKKVKSDSSIYFKESENKIMPFYDVSAKSLIGRASVGDVSAVERILESGVDVNYTDDYGTTALHEAALNGHKYLASTLLRNGAKHLPNKTGDTPLHYAAGSGYENVVKLFLENEVDVNIKGYFEKTALHYAAQSGHTNVLLTLLENGAEHLPDKNKDTPLHWAVKYRKGEAVSLLLKYGACINSRGWKGMTALHYAVQYDFKDIIALIIRYRADSKLKNDQGETALDLAKDQQGIIKVFIENCTLQI